MRWLLLAFSLALACGPAPSAPDAAVDAPDAAVPFVAPTPAAPPVFEPCPAGWSPIQVEGELTLCEPPSGEACATGLERFADSPACVPVGDACPSGPWAQAPTDASSLLYVSAGASGGNGTQLLPYGDIQTAILNAPPGAAILVAKGTYDETIDIYGSLRVIGACAAETILAPSTGAFAVRVSERGTALSNVTIRPSGDVAGIEVSGELSIFGVEIENTVDDGIVVTDGGSLSANTLVIRDVRVRTALFGRGIGVENSTVVVERAILERLPGAAIIASSGAQVTARSIIARESGREIHGSPQLIAQAGGVLEISSSLIEDGAGTGLLGNLGGVVRADQLVIRRHHLDPTLGGATAGFILREGSHIEASRLRIEDVDVFGGALIEGCTAQLDDLYIARIARTTFEAGYGLSTKGELTVRRAFIVDAETLGFIAGSTSIDIEDLTVRRCGSTEFFTQACSLADVHGTFRRAHFADNLGAGFVAWGPMTDLSVSDLHVENSLSGIAMDRGRGIEIRDGVASLSRVLVERSREVGILAYFGAQISLTDVRVLDTRERECVTTTCSDAPGGSGLASVDATVLAQGFEIAGARLCGAQVAGAGELDLRDGQIRAAAIGACVQRAGYDETRLTTDVLYSENGINVDSMDHTIPPPSDPLVGIEL